MGAMERARYYAEMLGCDVGVFYKRRDLSKVVNGKNPIVEHMYMGANPEGKDIIIVDDMIATGGWEKIHDIWERTKYKNDSTGE
jgi:ribose-phosphate pyrophosphokinase